MIFKTERLEVKELKEKDKAFFIDLLSAPEIIEPIPQDKWPLNEVLNKFEEFRDYSIKPEFKETTIWGVYETDQTALIGLCALLTNDENQKEIAYRFRKIHWGKGYGTELTRNMIDYCFSQLGINLLSADVNIENIGSVKILEKFFTPVREFYNESDRCRDRRYSLSKENWKKEN